MEWWWERLQDQCFIEAQFGISVDQKWVSVADCFFDLYVLKLPGYNAAFWNMHERDIIESDGCISVVHKEMVSHLVFFHFSSFDSTTPARLSKRMPVGFRLENETLNRLAIEYRDLLLDLGEKVPVKRTYSYANFENGYAITDLARRAYSSVAHDLTQLSYPFTVDSEIYNFCKKNYLVRSRHPVVDAPGLADFSPNDLKYRTLFLALKLTLAVLGPVRFNMLSRLFVFVSSFRRLKGLWRS